MPYPVENLIEGRRQPTTVRPSELAQKALALMIEHDFSQLPVVDEANRPLGLVTHESILRALSNFALKLEELRVSNAIVTAETYRPEDDLFDLLDRLKDTNAVLIVDGEERLIGIVTSYDSTEYFRRRAEDMMLVEDIETMVKDLISAVYTDDKGDPDKERLTEMVQEVTSSRRGLLARYQNALRHYLKLQGHEAPQIEHTHVEDSFTHLAPQEQPKDFDDLTLYEYTELLLHKDYWQYYGTFFELGTGALRNLLSGVRQTRNALAHFRGDISATQRDQLRFCAKWLAQHPVERLIEHLMGIPVAWPVPEGKTELQTVSVHEEGAPYEAPAEPGETIFPTEEVLEPDDSRYAPLAIWLQSRPSKEDRIGLTFGEVEEIIKGDLPPSARVHRSWWANDSVGHVQSQQWLDVGWRVAQINMTEEKVSFARIREREAAYIAFFSGLLAELRKKSEFPLRDLGPDGQSWHTAASLPEHAPKCMLFVFAFSRRARFRVELYIDTGHQKRNKRIFDGLYANRDSVHDTLGTLIAWERLSEKRASRIAWYRPGTITDNEATLNQVRRWAVSAMVQFHNVLAEPAVREFDASALLEP
jgi:hypothetical protein